MAQANSLLLSLVYFIFCGRELSIMPYNSFKKVYRHFAVQKLSGKPVHSHSGKYDYACRFGTQKSSDRSLTGFAVPVQESSAKQRGVKRRAFRTSVCGANAVLLRHKAFASRNTNKHQ
jgi:hypothetical protein